MSNSQHLVSSRLAPEFALPTTTAWDGILAWLVLFLSSGAFLGFITSDGDSQAGNGNAIMQFLWALLYLIIIFRLARTDKPLRFFGDFKLLALVLVIVFVSASWSVDPAVTLRHATGLLGSTFAGIYFGRRISTDVLLRLLMSVLAWGGLLSLLLVILLPKVGIMSDFDVRGAWRGIFAHKNGLGHMMLLLIAVCYILWKSGCESRWKLSLIALLAGFLLIKSQSKSSIIILVLMAGFLPFAGLLRRRQRLLVPLLTTAAAIGFAAVGICANFERILDLLGKNATISGRIPLWIMVGLSITQKPWLGFGYGAFWENKNEFFDAVTRHAGWTSSHAHNGFLQITLDAGLVGLVLALLLLIQVAIRAIKQMRADASVLSMWPFLFVIVFVLCNLDETMFLVPNNLSWILFVTVLVSTSPVEARIVQAAQPTINMRAVVSPI